MKSAILYRVASVLLVLFAAGHTLGFRKIDSQWNIGAVIQGMQTNRFTAQGFTRTYWDFYVGFGLLVSALLLFAAVVAWQLGGLHGDALVAARGIGCALAGCFVVVTFLTWRYFFVAPLVFSLVITVCLGLAAWLSGRG